MHTLQGFSELDPEATITSVDGVSEYDMTSRRSMLEALRQLPEEGQRSRSSGFFYGRTLEYLWEDDFGVVHRIAQGAIFCSPVSGADLMWPRECSPCQWLGSERRG